MDSKQIHGVGGRHKCNTVDKIEFEKIKPKRQNIVKNKKVKCDICGRSKSQIFT